MNQIIKTHKPTMRNFRRDEEAVRELSEFLDAGVETFAFTFG
jgi:hypothetical protein